MTKGRDPEPEAVRALLEAILADLQSDAVYVGAAEFIASVHPLANLLDEMERHRPDPHREDEP